MPDLMIEHVRTCAQNLFFEYKAKGSKGKIYTVTYCQSHQGQYQYGWFCECPDFVCRKRECKHIRAAKKIKCNWGFEAFMGSQTVPNIDNTCPNCGGETRVIRVGV